MLCDEVVALAERVEFLLDHSRPHLEMDATASRAVPLAALEPDRRLARELAATADERPVLLHGDMHPGNVLGGGDARGLVAIDPRSCVGDPAFDGIDRVSWGIDDPRRWRAHSDALAAALGSDAPRLWAWCAAFAAMLAAVVARGGGQDERVAALLALGP